MIDRSIAYKSIIMRCDKVNKQAFLELPVQLSLRRYQSGDEKHWVALHESIGEFEGYTTEGIYQYFSEKYLTHLSDTMERCLFLVDNRDGQYLATCSAWFEPKGSYLIPVVHWLAVRDGYEGRGYARMMITAVMKLFHELYGDTVPIYLHTQPCSYQAVKLYHDFGFCITKQDTYSNAINEFEDAMVELKKYLRPDIYQKIEETAVV